MQNKDFPLYKTYQPTHKKQTCQRVDPHAGSKWLIHGNKYLSHNAWDNPEYV